MKKMKKIFAVLLTLAMVLGMNATVFAAPGDGTDPAPAATAKTATITVKNLKEGTTVKFFKMISWSESGGWTAETWAGDYLTENTTTKTWTINQTAFTNLNGTAPSTATQYKTSQVVQPNETTVSLEVDPGTYMIEAKGTDNTIVYGLMVASTFNEETLTVNENQTVIAKGEKFGITKTIINEAGDDLGQKNFVGIGDVIKFKVVTYFPYFDPDATANLSYTIVDTPEGMTLSSPAKVKIGNGTEADVAVTSRTNATTQKTEYVIDLTDKIVKTDNKPTNANAGDPVVITYSGTVTGENGYTNKVAAYKNGESDPITPPPTPDDPPVKGFTGDISIKKYAENDAHANDTPGEERWNALTGLAGAEFTVSRVGDTSGNNLKFVTTGTPGVYKLALATDTGADEKVKVNDNGIVKVMGLGEGTYNFVEVTAPAGYSVDSNPVPVKIEKAANAEQLTSVSMKDAKMDTTLASLPSTGGIGTTIFTIGGCAIMIIAAGLYFATRRKTAK